MPLTPFMPDEANPEVYKKEWRYQEGEYTVTRTAHWSGPGCHDSCGLLLYTDKDGKLVKVEGDPQSPYNNGRLCMRCLNMPEAVNHPDRLKYPMRRAGERGENKWERISWDEAYDEIEAQVRSIWDEYGPESIVAMEGTGRNAIWQVPFLCHAAFRSPNFALGFLSGSACYLPRSAAAAVQSGEQQILDASQLNPLRYGNPDWEPPEVIILWGNEPLKSNPDGFLGHWIVDMMKFGTKLIVVDPSLTWLGAKADYWLRLRPGTDGAMTLAFLNVVIEEDLIDHDFVDNWTYGFDTLAERAKQWPPERAAEICWCDADDIREAARMFGKAKRAGIQWGLALDQQPDGISAAQGLSSLVAITGNLDVPGGNVIMRNGFNMSIHYSIGTEYVDPDVFAKRLGAGLSVLYQYGSVVAQEDSVLRAMEMGEPYPIRMLWLQSTNPIANMAAEAPRVYQAVQKVPFIVDVDLFMTPTAVAFADLVLPCAMSCERNSIRVWWTPLRSIAKASQYYEAKSDETIIIELGARLNPEVFGRFKDDIDYLNWNLTGDGNYGHDWLSLREKVFEFDPFLYEYRKYERGMLREDGQVGFNTMSGKFELSPMLFEATGYESVAYHVEPSRSPYSTPELYKEYPLVMTTGQRSWEWFHSEHRQLKTHRAQHPYPFVEMHSEAMEKYGITPGQWVWIENDLGRCKQIAKVNDTLDPRVIRAEHGWWFPEENPEELFRVFDSNINNLTPMFHNSPTGYGAPYKCQLAKVYPVTPENMEPLPTDLVVKGGGFRDYSDWTKNNYGNYGNYGTVSPDGLIDYGLGEQGKVPTMPDYDPQA